MEDVRFQNDVPAPLHLSDTLDRNSSKPQGLAKKNWNDLKPTIRELYLDQGQTLKQLANCLKEHHGFRPTKKQLLYRISGWGFEKNVKKNERRAIIEHLGPELGKVEFEAQTLRGRTLDEAKLNRWMKLEKVTFEESLAEANEVACAPGSVVPFEQNFGPAEQDSEKRAPTQTSNYEEQNEFGLQLQESHSVSVLPYNDNSFDWNSVDVIGSPGLTKLIGALTIEECDIPLLDLASESLGADDISGSDLMDLCGGCDSAQEEYIISRRQSWPTRLSTSMETSQTFRNFEKSSHFGLQLELYPFPTLSSQSYVVHRLFFSSGSLKHKLSESECKIKLQNLKHMQETEIIHLVEAMGAKAEELYNHQCFDIAETWFRRVVRAENLTNWYKLHQTLWACLRVTESLRLQFRYREAQQLQQGLHGTIERTFGAHHGISIESRELNADLLAHLGFRAEAEPVLRQVLQICLNTLGVRHPKTIDALENLGSVLNTLGRHGEAQHLLEPSLRFRLERVKKSGDSLTGEIVALSDVALLAQSLNRNMRYDESENVLDCAQNLLGEATRSSSMSSLQYHQERAYTYRLQKRFQKSENILRGLLKYHLNHMAPGTSMNSMDELAKILVETGRHREAASWRRKEYLLRVKTFGLTHHYTMDCCEAFGSFYADQSRYNEAKLFFEEVIEMLDLSSEEPDSRAVCIQNINSWIEQLEVMKVKDSIEGGSKTSESVESEREPMDTDDDVDYKDMGDISDPLDCW